MMVVHMSPKDVEALEPCFVRLTEFGNELPNWLIELGVLLGVYKEEK